MIQIYEPHDTTLKLLGTPAISAEKEYHESIYLLKYEIEYGLLVYNVMTREMLLLNDEEKKAFQEKKYIENEAYKQLIEKWFLIDNETDERKVLKQIRDFLSTFFYSHKNPIVRFTILPTTACNARCFYCFERDRTHVHMTPQVASDVADYIIKQSRGNPIKLRWFGGEPLFNAKAIDIICDKLNEAGVNFQSNATSNGYLFDKEMVAKAKEKWHLTNVQITLDGTEEIYNKAKNYIYKNVNPYEIVTRNIGYLLEAGISVPVRMNMDSHNQDDLYKLTDEIVARYGHYPNFLVYAHLLFEDSGEEQINRTDDERHELIRKYIEFDKYLASKIRRKPRTVGNLIQYHQCMADDPSSTSIMPDGSLGKCEHYSDTDFWGSIYNDEVNLNTIKDFKTFKYLGEQCDNCCLRPACFELVKCAQTVNRCDSVDFNLKMFRVNKVIHETFNNYLKDHPEIKNMIKDK